MLGEHEIGLEIITALDIQAFRVVALSRYKPRGNVFYYFHDKVRFTEPSRRLLLDKTYAWTLD